MMRESFGFGPACRSRLAGAAWATMASLFAPVSAIVAGSSPADAQSSPPPAVALVTDVVGRIDPAVEPFSEMPAGSTVRLAPGATINVLFYASCEELSI